MSAASHSSPIAGLDHLVIAVGDLEQAAAGWTALGFTLSPQGFHPPELGTANHTIMLGRDYIELLGVARATDYNARTLAFIGEGEGVEHFALASDDADAVASFMRGQGHAPVGPGIFGRAVRRPDGLEGEARFGIVRWPPGVTTAGIGLFVCQHLTPDWVWLPDLTRHRNHAVGIATVYVAAADPAREAAAFSAATGLEVAEASGGVLVRGRDGRATMHYAPIAALAARLSAEALAGARAEGVVAVDIATRDIGSALAAARLTAIGQRVPASGLNGVSLGFVEDGLQAAG
ncbi:VOC family protein [Phreatobacter sp.]|uniref:VOC family protein n=1 Tax=Phreatobacter sp. TaxID=1966341 RepID=UPI003F7293D4